MSSIEIRATNSPKYPESITYSLYLGEVDLPGGIQMKRGDQYVTRTQWLGTLGEEGIKRNFFEQTRTTKKPEGLHISPAEEQEILIDFAVPVAPSRWDNAMTLFVPSRKTLAVVEFPLDSTPQSRVTTISQKETDPAQPVIVFASTNKLVDHLEQKGFPQGALHYWREDTQSFHETEGATAAYLRATEPLAKLVTRVIDLV